MSWSSASSAGRRRGAAEGRAPVPYRENPMAYEPPRLCGCNPRRKAPRWISWSAQNPGRRYYVCMDAMNGRGCGYVEWHDDPLPRFWSHLLGYLRDEMWRLRASGNSARSEEDSETRTSVVDSVAQATIKAMEIELKEKDAEIARMKAKYENVIFVLFALVFGLVAGKTLMQ
uniref:Uncharacterized protein n=3 Tax=Avena sativa TaxID=4498 RepID=A0ACD5X239_AVESA